MDADDELCLCFHVSRRKLENFVRVEDIRRASQLSECFGAGTGCGWCRPFLRQLFEESQSGNPAEPLTPAEYAKRRAVYIRAGGGTPPPGAEPVAAEEGEVDEADVTDDARDKPGR
jgi:bacterioferritin-associated ferredoxin